LRSSGFSPPAGACATRNDGASALAPAEKSASAASDTPASRPAANVPEAMERDLECIVCDSPTIKRIGSLSCRCSDEMGNSGRPRGEDAAKRGHADLARLR
jgi:hypothetical protein